MADTQPPLFDDKARTLRIHRARRRQGGDLPFLADRVIADLSERLLDVNRTFRSARLIGPFDWRKPIENALPEGKKPTDFVYSRDPAGSDHDLILSLLDLQSLDDLPGWMRAMRRALAPDGLFIAAFIGGESLSSVRQSFYAQDTEALGAPTPRFHPMITVRQAAPLLSHIGLALPVIDSDRFTAHYRQLGTWVTDLRDLALTNIMTDRAQSYPGRSVFNALEALLRPEADQPIPIVWDIIWMTGWAPHESQQKPLKPGTAKTPLHQALRDIRDEG